MLVFHTASMRESWDLDTGSLAAEPPFMAIIWSV